MNRCEHGIYLPEGDRASGKAWGCTLCYSQGHPESTAIPILPHSSGTPLNLRQTDGLDFCPCGAIALTTRDTCNICGQRYPSEILVRHQGTANAKVPGVCPDCGSNIHYAHKAQPGIWECVDCGRTYVAPKGRE